MRPVGLDPASPTYASDLLHYRGYWSGDVSAFAGQVVELRIGDLGSPREMPTLFIDDIRFLPIPEPSTTALLGLGMLVLPFAAAWSSRSRKRTGKPQVGLDVRR